MRSTVASGGASWAAARSSTPTRSRPGSFKGVLLLKGTQLVNWKRGNCASSADSASRVAWALLVGSQAMASSVQGSSALSTFTAACLSSGCLDVGQ